MARSIAQIEKDLEAYWREYRIKEAKRLLTQEGYELIKVRGNGRRKGVTMECVDTSDSFYDAFGGGSMKEVRDNIERKIITNLLLQHKGNMSAVAKILKLHSGGTLGAVCDRLNIDVNTIKDTFHGQQQRDTRHRHAH